MKDGDIDERKNPAIGEMEKEANKFCSVAAGSKNRPQQIGDIHPCHTESLACRKNGSEYHGSRKPPDQPLQPVHDVRLMLFPPSSMSRNVSAALITPRCVNACGKFPSASPVSGSISSAKRPTSLAKVRTAS